MPHRITREFRWTAWLYGPLAPDSEAIFHEETIAIEVACDGPYLAEHGHFDALNLMERSFAPWLGKQWENRLLLDSTDRKLLARCQRQDWPRSPVALPKIDTGEGMARYLLSEILQPMLLGKGLNVLHVVVKRQNLEPVCATASTRRQGGVDTRQLPMPTELKQTTISYGPALVG